MTLNSELIALMDKARSLTGLTDKISIDRLTELMNYFDLHVNHNLIDNADTLAGDGFLPFGITYSSINGHTVANSGGHQWSQFMCLVSLNAGKTYTFSETVSGPLMNGNVSFILQNSTGSEEYILNNITIPDDESEHRLSYTFSVKSDGTYRVFFTNAKTFCLPKLETGELSTPIQGGGVAEVIQDSTTESVISEYIKATESNGITTLSSEEGGPSKRCLIAANSDSTLTDDMLLIMVARKSANSQYDSIDFQIGGFDALSNLTISLSNWGLYSIRLKKSKSGTISLYCTEKGDLIDIRYFAVVKTAKYDN